MNRLIYRLFRTIPLRLLLLLLLSAPLLAQTNISATVQIHAGGGKIAEYGSLTFNAGYVITPRASPNDNLSFRPGSSYAGASNASHVDGYAEVVGSSAFTFPIGDGTTLRPAGISTPTTSGLFQAAYFAGDPGTATLPTGAPFSRTALSPGLSSVRNTEYWDINGPSAVNITLTGIVVPADGGIYLTIVGWDGTKWVDLGGTVSVPNSTITTTTPLVPDTYTAYTIGTKTPPPPTVSISGPAAGTTTTDPNPPITGFATIGSSITITGGPGSSGGPCVVTTGPFTGNWTCTSLTFTTGLQTVTAISGNSGGNSSPATRSFSVTAPTSPTTSAACGIVIHGPTDVEVHPGGTMAVYCDVTFVDGYVNTPRPTPNDNIVFMPGTTYFDASDDSHVNGYTEKVGNTAFVFPVGDGTVLRPVGMSAPASMTSTLQAAYFSTNPTSATLPTGAPFATTSRGTGVTAVSPVEYWDVNGSEAVDLTFTWNPASNLNTLTGSTLSNLIMVGWDGTKWVDLGSPTTTGTLSSTGTLKVAGITPNTYTAYTFGAKSVPPSCPTPSVGGTVAFAGTQPLCSTANTGTLTLSGQTGNVVRWETSTDGGTTFSPIANTTNTLNFSNVQNNQQYRAVVNVGGSCTDATSAPVTLTTSAGACSLVANCEFAEAVIAK